MIGVVLIVGAVGCCFLALVLLSSGYPYDVSNIFNLLMFDREDELYIDWLW